MLTVDADLILCKEALRLRTALTTQFGISDTEAIGYLFRVALLLDSAGADPFLSTRDIDWALAYGEIPGLGEAFVEAGMLVSVGGKVSLAPIHAWHRPQPREYGPTWGAAKKSALERDGHACRKCGADAGLHVHHVKRLRDFDGDTDSANRLSNLITLCGSCHLDAHRKLRAEARR